MYEYTNTDGNVVYTCLMYMMFLRDDEDADLQTWC